MNGMQKAGDAMITAGSLTFWAGLAVVVIGSVVAALTAPAAAQSDSSAE